MSLGLSLTNALSGLKASQQSIAVISQNIANANNPNYSRQISSQEAISVGNQIGSGVKLGEVTRITDQFIARTIITRNSLTERASTIKDYYEETQIYFGQPGQDNSIDSYVQKFFDSLSSLSVTVERSSSKLNAVSSGENLASEISNLARNVETLRFEADREIETSISKINGLLRKIQGLNASITSATSLGQSKTAIQDQMETAMQDLSKEMNIQYFYSGDDTVTIFTANGIPLLENGLYQLQYSKASSIDQFISDLPSNAITVNRVNSFGELETDSFFTLASGGSRSGVVNYLEGGKLKGLLDIRDTLMPNILDQLDMLASTLRDQMNAIHNNGSAYPPLNSFSGTTLIDPTASDYWGGKVMISALSPIGTPATSPYASQTADGIGYEPLILDLANLEDGGLAGKASYQSIIDEINHHFGAPETRVGIGDLHNIELVAKSDVLTAGSGTFDFTFETNNLSADDVTYRVTGITVPDDVAVTVTAPASFPTSDLTSTAGQKAMESGTAFTLDMTGSGAGPYTISVAVEVDDGAGGTYTDTIDYVVTATTEGLYNDRYAASSISGAGDATLENPTTSQSFLRAILVDENGAEVDRDSTTGDYITSGYLKLIGNSNNDYRMAISEMDSTHLGDGVSTGTNFGFSHYLGLNNFFEDNNNQLADSAINFAVRADIIAEPARISTASLQLSSQPSDTTSPPRYTYEISPGDSSSALALSNISVTPIVFESAGGISQISLDFAGYAAEILGFNAAIASQANEDYRQESLILEGFTDKYDAIRGVDVDEELANTIIFQNAYSANARIINVTKELFDALLRAF
ncbi:MAG: flagellar hook-associated protein FlgK [Alphaproteobacteria bacterium CG11_big_fil_rev_8_21_14_0_20_44_7]|nr:MAG: flagellar hook-associated protein FlgK [Alphaproteobacteria bacterium CG11_big_fil_rev_8_21_14_0_20_44_7]